MDVEMRKRTFRNVYVTNFNRRYDRAPLDAVSPNWQPVHRGQLFPDHPPTRPETMAREADQVLDNFDPKQDVLLLGGDPYSIAVCTHYLASRFSKYTVGKYDRELGGYYFIDIK